jgi:hypothetical protein
MEERREERIYEGVRQQQRNNQGLTAYAARLSSRA